MASSYPEINGAYGGYRIGGYRELAVPPALAPVAEVAWRYSADGRIPLPDEAAARVLPETGVSLVFDCHRDSRGRVDTGSLLVMGPVAAFRFYRPEPGAELAGIRLRPECCLEILGLRPGEIADAILEPRRQRWTGNLQERLRRTRNLAAVAAELQAAVSRRQAAITGSYSMPIAHRALALLRRGGGAVETARAVGVSPRHLRRIVTGSCGFGIKWFQRVRRLHRVVSASAAAPPGTWATLAAAAGFCDQAHMIREFRALAGVTPVELLAERR